MSAITDDLATFRRNATDLRDEIAARLDILEADDDPYNQAASAKWYSALTDAYEALDTIVAYAGERAPGDSDGSEP